MQKVYFLVPNLIDYVRIILNLAAFYCMLSKPFLAIALHFTGGIVLDVADGISARYLNQCSKYGDLLDNLLDRCGRIGMMMALCVFYPQYLFALQLLVCLEVAGGISNHYRCSLMTDPSLPSDNYEKAHCYGPWLLRNYFQEPFLTLVIIGQDVCVAMLYLLHFSPGPVVSLAGTSYSLWVMLAWICAPFLIYRQVIVHGLLVIDSFRDLARLHEQENSKKKQHKN
ncbi:hypothetical protein ACROYT_G008861 [Oculina patagonica]